MASKSARNDDPEFPTREHVGDWPYIPQYLQSSLDPDLIEEHGEAVLRRALNSKRLVCFVGTGISMAYGRIGWGDLVRRLIQAEVAKTDGDPNPLVQRLRTTLKELKLDGRRTSDSSRGNRYPAAFQFGERLEEARLSRSKSVSKETPFRQHAMQLLYDDRGHAHLLFKDLLEDLDEIGGAPMSKDIAAVLDRFIPLAQPHDLTRGAIYGADTHSMDSRYPDWRNLFDLDQASLDYWMGKATERFGPGGAVSSSVVAGHALSLLKTVREHTEHVHGDEENRRRTLPLHRFLVPAVLRLTADRESFRKLKASTQNEPPAIDLAKVYGHDTRQQRHPVRADTVPAARDPLALLAGGLSISRFITTNYDLDIERLLRDRGFAPVRPHLRVGDRTGAAGAGAPTETNDALGAEARDSVFRADRALELVDFSVHNPSHAFNVVHLHGRATHGDDMIVTERDYLQRYLRKGDEADLVNLSISVAFAANPILFVGSGMSEDDILRPLRQFVAERRNQADRKAVVLLPAGGQRSRQIEEAIGHYSRFGVFTVHYGFARFRSDPPEREHPSGIRQDPVSKRCRWLSLMNELCGGLEEWLGKLVAYLDAVKKLVAAVDKKAKHEASHVVGQAHSALRAAAEKLRFDSPPGDPSPASNWQQLLEWQGPKSTVARVM